MGRKIKPNYLKEYKTTLILLSILIAIMSLIIFMPLKNDNKADNGIILTHNK